MLTPPCNLISDGETSGADVSDFLTMSHFTVHFKPDGRPSILVNDILVNCIVLGLNKIKGMHDVWHLV